MSNQSEAIFTAIIANAGAEDATIILPGSSTATRKRYKYALTGQQLSAGDRVYVIPISGTYVLLGGAVAGGGGSLPAGGAIYDALVKQSSAAGDAIWSPLLYRGADGGLCEVDEI